MPRKLRIEYPGAIYHVLNRGNYRAWVFDTPGARDALERCLLQACERNGWILHAYVVMGNHYHLALETPGGNLSGGMQWFESTFANRFNRIRQERGHVFQGRYKALVVEPGSGGLGRLCHYIHLNPCRAGLCDISRLAAYRHSSYWRMRHAEARRPCLRFDTALAAAGGLADHAEGWRRYEEYLAFQLKQGPAGRDAAYARLSQGWAIGTEGFRATLLEYHRNIELMRAWGRHGGAQAREQSWQLELDRYLARLSEAERGDKTKSAPWKLAIVQSMKRNTGASNDWLASRLEMGSGKYVSRLMSDVEYRRRITQELRDRLDVKCEA